MTKPSRTLIKEPGKLPDLAIVETSRGKRYVVTYGRGWLLRASRLAPKKRPELSHEAGVLFDLSPDGRYPSAVREPLFFRGIVLTDHARC